MGNIEFNRIALFGAGATGTIIGALLAEAGKDIILVNRNIQHVNALNKKGAVIIGGIEKTIPVKAVTPDKLVGKFDLVIYCAKSTADDTALPQLISHLHQNSVVLTTQNGVPEEKIASFVSAQDKREQIDRNLTRLPVLISQNKLGESHRIIEEVKSDLNECKRLAKEKAREEKRLAREQRLATPAPLPPPVEVENDGLQAAAVLLNL